MSRKRTRSTSPAPDHPTEVFVSSPIEDRASTFIAYYSPQLTAEALQGLPECKSASHRIAAWRRPSSQRALSSKRILETGFDDDGEKHGGKTVEKVLVSMQVEGALVVARWYGGVMLGPVRFDHMKDCATEAIANWKQATEQAVKKAKRDEEEAVRQSQLATTLRARDQSIVVLRDLLAEKSQTVSSSASLARPPSSSPQQQDGDGPKSSPSKPQPDYADMPLAALERLEKARDATIAWILKQIDKAEVESDGHGALSAAENKKPDISDKSPPGTSQSG